MTHTVFPTFFQIFTQKPCCIYQATWPARSEVSQVGQAVSCPGGRWAHQLVGHRVSSRLLTGALYMGPLINGRKSKDFTGIIICKTNISPENRPGPKVGKSSSKPSIFRCELAVSFREGITHPTSGVMDPLFITAFWAPPCISKDVMKNMLMHTCSQDAGLSGKRTPASKHKNPGWWFFNFF